MVLNLIKYWSILYIFYRLEIAWNENRLDFIKNDINCVLNGPNIQDQLHYSFSKRKGAKLPSYNNA
jgi:hypothetical protein